MAVVSKSSGTLSASKPKRREEPESGLAELALPTVKSTPSTSLGDYSILLFGAEKVGKTTLAAQFPDALFLMCEPGGKALEIYQTPVTSWTAFRKTLRLLEKEKRFKTIVVDTIDIAFKYCEKSVCRKMGIDHPSDEDWGKGWNRVRDEFVEAMALLLSLGRGVILISHSSEREIKTRSGEKYHIIGPTMAGQARSVIQPMVDLWLYYAHHKGERTLVIRGDEHVTAGVRCGQNFLNADKTPINELSMGASAEEAYRNVIAAFNNRYVAPKRTTSKTKE